MSEPAIIISCLAGRTAMSLLAMKGVPASISTSRSSTTRASRVRDLSLRDNSRRVSPMMESGVRPSACNASCELFDIVAPM